MVARIRHDHLPSRACRDSPGCGKLSGCASGLAIDPARLALRIENLDAIVAVLAHVDHSLGVRRQIIRISELSQAVSHFAPNRLQLSLGTEYLETMIARVRDNQSPRRDPDNR